MFRALIASTFLTAAVAFPVMAQSTNTDAGASGAATMDSGAATGTMDTKPAVPGVGTAGSADVTADAQAKPMMNLEGKEFAANQLIGTSITDGNDESIGEIGDIILSTEGGVQSYIVNVGGFLGIGDKPVAIAPDQLTIMADADGNFSVKTAMTKEQLESAPQFDATKYPMDAAAPATK
jgi:sporulation protein YlmC with PRC-barrel domain